MAHRHSAWSHWYRLGDLVNQQWYMVQVLHLITSLRTSCPPKSKASMNIQTCYQNLKLCITWAVENESLGFPHSPSSRTGPLFHPENYCPESSPQQGCSTYQKNSEPVIPSMLLPAFMSKTCGMCLPWEEPTVCLCTSWMNHGAGLAKFTGNKE